MGATAERTEESCGEAAFKCKIEEIRNYKVNFADAKKILHMSRSLDVQDDTLSVRAVALLRVFRQLAFFRRRVAEDVDPYGIG